MAGKKVIVMGEISAATKVWMWDGSVESGWAAMLVTKLVEQKRAW